MSNLRLTLITLLISFIVLANPTFAADLAVSGWIPYWAVENGIKDATKHLDQLTELNPFGYSVKTTGQLNDLAEIKGKHEKRWAKLFKAARKKDILIIPTVMWSDGATIHQILSNDKERARHIRAIISMIKKGKYDGVDIDYEAKRTESREAFSTFIKELKKALGKKILSCTVEPRTPPDSLYTTLPPTTRYVNDYQVLAQYCDQVKIMAYDQRRADIKLNAAKNGRPYNPVADVDWVRKVVELTLKTIPKEKLSLGVPTYGYEYQIAVAPNQYRDYLKLRSLNPTDALATAAKYGATPNRDRAGEMSFSYLATPSPIPIYPLPPLPLGTPSGEVIAAKALSFSNVSGFGAVFNLVMWSDAAAIKQKVDLVKEFDLTGVAIFKIDGEEDQKLWEIFED